MRSNFNLGMKSVRNPVLHIRRQAWQSGILIFYQDTTTKVPIRALILHYIVRFRDINIWKFSGPDCQACLNERYSAELGSIQFRKDPLRLVIITMTLWRFFTTKVYVTILKCRVSSSKILHCFFGFFFFIKNRFQEISDSLDNL